MLWSGCPQLRSKISRRVCDWEGQQISGVDRVEAVRVGRSFAASASGVDRAARRGRGAFRAAMSAAGRVMTTGVSGHRRRTAVSVSLPVTSSDPVEQLDQIVETFHQVNRALPKTVLGREELIAVGGLLIQISGALLTLTDLLSVSTHQHDRARLRRADTDTTPIQRLPVATSLLRDCRDGVLAAYNSARAFHADLRRCSRTRAHRDNGGPSSGSQL